MARTRTFDQTTVISLAAAQFRDTGYEGTSIDDLVNVTGLQRGSLYKAFGSKRGIFLLAIEHTFATSAFDDDALDLALVSLLELAPRDREVRTHLEGFLRRLPDAAQALGNRLIARAGIAQDFG